ncbi:S-adenosyl-L-methionine-dependent methyltransferase [Viridothelium virens]|uniref:S-adenosyl-L-methionine-dependent methyltransferase n=1 Tax=Viridothelium virens TaxID=1048519 RepID=A0A6A6HF45_VIRVR|nr:S-adenosyl-L-methionine-dependent methyltransferase [Viridothelium virens]
MCSAEDNSNFFKRADYDEDYWNNYLAARPDYDQPFYQSIYDYHESHLGLTNTAHDVATGPGQVAAQLSTHFDKVIASDINDTHLAVARHRLGSLVTLKKVDLRHCSAEGLEETTPPNSVDLITAAECFPLLDAEKTTKAFARMLRPNGTLAIWFYGRPVFAEPAYARQCQPILESILDTAFAKIIKGGGPQQKAGFKRGTDRMASFFDDVEFKSDVWQHVERRKWNAEYAMPFYGPEACDFEITPSSAIEDGEKVVEKKDLTFWERQWDITGVRRFVLANLPTFDKNIEDERLMTKYKELEEAMGGEGAIRKITWPVVLILASKK